jgi:hypothetical protein
MINVYVYMYMYMCIYVYIYIYMSLGYLIDRGKELGTYGFVCMIYVCMYVCMHVYMFICMYAYLCICIYIYICIYIHEIGINLLQSLSRVPSERASSRNDYDLYGEEHESGIHITGDLYTYV